MSAGSNKTYLDVGTDGRITQKNGTTTATANSIIVTDGTGRLSTAQLPVGVGPEIITLQVGVKILNGDFVSIYYDTPTSRLLVRPADASNNYPAHGFVITGNDPGGNVDIFSISQTNTAATTPDAGGVLSPGKEYYLAPNAGKITATVPTGTGQLVQFIGVATAASTVLFAGGTVIKLA